MKPEKLLYYPLNGFEMQKMNPDAEIITYDKLNNISNINDLFKNTNKLIILYMLHDWGGHWVCLIKNPNGTFTFWDSYGHRPDYQIDVLNNKQRKEYNEKTQRLHKLLKKYFVIYNNRCIQGKGTQTCGCFATHRLHHSEYSNPEYRYKFFNGKNPDLVVAGYCSKILNN